MRSSGRFLVLTLVCVGSPLVSVADTGSSPGVDVSFFPRAGCGTPLELGEPRGLAASAASGEVAIADAGAHRVLAVDAAFNSRVLLGSGVQGFNGDHTMAPADMELSAPSAVVYGPDGQVYVADTMNHRVRRIDTLRGLAWTVAGGDAETALLSPLGLAADVPNRWLYIADSGNHAVRRLDLATGLLTTAVGEPGQPGNSTGSGDPLAARLDDPAGLAVLADGTLLIADRGNHCIRALTSGVLSTWAGTCGTPGSSGDGGSRVLALLQGPIQLAVDPAGNVYFTEQRADRLVRTVGADGVIGTLGYDYDGAYGVATDSANRLYLGNMIEPSVHEVLRTPQAPLLISELDWDQPGADALEFIELYNRSGAPVDLSAYTVKLINGSDGNSYKTIALPAVELAADDYFVIGAAAVANVDLTPPSFSIQNGPTSGADQHGESVVIYEGTTCIDALAYEDAGGLELDAVTEGRSLRTSDAGGDVLFSAQRLPAGHDTNVNARDFVDGPPTPGAAPRLDGPPVCRAGGPRTVTLGDSVELDASDTEDPDGDTLSGLAWSVTLAPAGGTAQPASPGVLATTFTPDVAGLWVLQFAARDRRTRCSDRALVVVIAPGPNQAPLADVGDDRSVVQGRLVLLDGSGSSDPDASGALAYSWRLTPPPGSQAALSTEEGAGTSFRADRAGDYLVELVVIDGRGAESAPDQAVISVTPAALRIGEVDPAQGGGDDLEFVELFAAGADVSLSDFELLLLTSAGSDYLRVPLPPGVLASGEWFVIGDDGVSNLDLAPASFALREPSGVAAAVVAGTSVAVDSLAWGPGPFSGGAEGYVEGAPAAADPDEVPGEGLSLQRARPELDAGDNRFEFVLRPPTPGAAVAANTAPIADAGGPREIRAGGPTFLDGGASNDPDGDALHYHWTAEDGTSHATLPVAAADEVVASFTAPAEGTYVVTVVVTDAFGATGDDSADLTALPNLAPVADAGPDQQTALGRLVQLDGTGSSDPDGLPQPLSYAWSITARPPGSAAAVVGADGARPTFEPDLAGIYRLALIVSDGAASSAADEVELDVVVTNIAPVADAGGDVSLDLDEPLALDGRASFDPDERPQVALDFAWTLAEGPLGSVVVIDAPSAATTAVTVDRIGTYTFQLEVSDGELTATDTVTVEVLQPNQLPSAAITSADQTVRLGQRVQVSGEGSDPEAAPLTFVWSFASRPAGSDATFSDANVAAPTFRPDRPGVFSVQLVVNDGRDDSPPVTTTITATPVRIVVNEVDYDQPGTDVTEFVELLNVGAQAADLGDFELVLVNQDGQSYKRVVLGAPGALLQPLDFFVIGEAAVGASVDVTITGDIQQGPCDAVAVVVKGTLTPLDTMTYACDAHAPGEFRFQEGKATGADPPGSAGGPQWSLGRYPDGADGDDNAADFVLHPPSPGAAFANTVPVAAAGADATVPTGRRVRLGGADSFDPDGDALEEEWTLVSAPVDSTAEVVVAPLEVPNFLPDVPGVYVAQLVVRDPFGGESLPDQVRFTAEPGPANLAPAAQAGPDRTVRTAAPFQLDGAASVDPDDAPDPLSFLWSLEGPPGSTARLDDDTAARPVFTPDLDGAYVATLVVTDGNLPSEADSVTITATPSELPPTAVLVGPAGEVQHGALIEVDGRGSHDPELRALSYTWTVQAPAGSASTLGGQGTAQVQLRADVAGEYVFSLVVNDTLLDSAPAEARVQVRPVGLKVSELDYAQPGPDDFEFVELFNADAQAVPLDNFDLVLSRPDGPSARIALAGELVAGDYHVLGDAAIAGADQALGGTSIPDIACRAVAVVVRGTTQVVDTVTYDCAGSAPGATQWQEGSAAPADPTANNAQLSLNRYPAGRDTGDNAADFHLHPPSPGAAFANRAPLANAGADGTGLSGRRIPLDGSASSDPDGDPLTFRWRLTERPESSAASVTDPGAARPNFLADVPGAYAAELVVSDPFDGVSAPATVRFTVTQGPPNLAPQAAVGPSRAVRLDTTVLLDGSASSDPDAAPDPLSYLWVFTAPEGSAAVLDDPAAAIPSFVTDVEGEYRATLTVSDGELFDVSEPIVITATLLPLPPVVVLDVASLQVQRGAAIVLDASGSYDPEGAAVSFAWTLEAPPGSAVSLTAQQLVAPRLTVRADVAGDYIFRLGVSDGALQAEPRFVSVTAAEVALRVNEVDYAQPGADDFEFVELFNAGSAEVALADFELVLGNDTGTYDRMSLDGGEEALPAAAFLVLGDAAIAEADLLLDGSMQNVGCRSVAVVVRGTSSIVDALTYDCAQPPEGFPWLEGAAAPADPENTGDVFSLGRWPDGADTGDNAADFHLHPPSPGGPYANAPPVAAVAPGGAGLTGRRMRLDARASSDPEEDALSFAWELVTRPEGSAAAVRDAGAALTDFVPDLAGRYVARVTVSDPFGGVAAPASVQYDVTLGPPNEGPRADAGRSRYVRTGSTVTLDGSASSDPDDAPDPLRFHWTLRAPAGSAAALDDAAAARPTFVADLDGEYVVTLRVDDGALASAPVEIRITATAQEEPPRAVLSGPDEAQRGSLIVADGTASFDPEAGALVFRWTVTLPEGSAAVVREEDLLRPTVTVRADVAGEYRFELAVTDEAGLTSEAEALVIEAVPVYLKLDEVDYKQFVAGDPDEFIELKNAGEVPVELTDFTVLLVNGANGDPYESIDLDPLAAAPERDTALAPGDWYVLGKVGVPESDQVLDKTMQNGPDIVALVVRGTRSIVDAVTYGTGIVGAAEAWAEGASAQEDPAVRDLPQSLQRFPDGWDTGNNGADFVIRAPSPGGPTTNARPEARVGLDLAVLQGAVVQLDGSGSRDADGDPLSYEWSLQAPEGSAAALSDPSVAAPTFTADVLGVYALELRVGDGQDRSDPAQLVVEALTSLPPVPDAGPGFEARVGRRVTLDGSRSSDPEGDELTYAWSLAVPDGSAAALEDGEDAAIAHFVPDVAGEYTATLTVGDGTSSRSAAIVVTAVPGTNARPVAEAGEDRSVPVGASVALDGSASRDGDEDPLSYAWTLVSKPEGSAAELTDAGTATPKFNADLAGAYVVDLVVNDGFDDSEADRVTITADSGNQAPVAAAGEDQVVKPGGRVMLDGSASSDPDEDALTYQWSFVERPAGSIALLDDPAAAAPSFTADLAGSYVVRLTVSDGELQALDEVTIEAKAGAGGGGGGCDCRAGGEGTGAGATAWLPLGALALVLGRARARARSRRDVRRCDGAA